MCIRDRNITPLKVKLRDGLGLMNGTSCMSGIGSINLIYSYRLLDWAIAASTMINEIVEAYDDSFSVGLNEVKLHAGQQEIAKSMREFLKDSTLTVSYTHLDVYKRQHLSNPNRTEK